MSKVVYLDEPQYSVSIDILWARVRTDTKKAYYRNDRRVIANDNLLEGL